MENRLNNDSFIVATLDGPEGSEGRFSLWAGAGEAEGHICSLLENGVPVSRIQVFRARSMARPRTLAAA